jgi:hypothetical protein
MSRDDIQKLLGGYATGTLTPEERQTLFATALEDQELFDALAREEPLREVLSDPAARAQLLSVLDGIPAPWYRRWWRPVPITALATALSLVAGVAIWQSSRAPLPRRMAKLEFPPLPSAGDTQSAPILPPPPEMKRTAPPLMPSSLPAAVPAAPPPPPTESKAALAMDKPLAIGGTISGGLAPPRQQMQQNGRFAPSAGNSLLEQTNVPLHGVVTDASGAGIRSASVVVKSGATGQVSTASTDERGEFSASAVPGSTYQVSASAPGFRSATLTGAAPALGTPEPVSLKLDVGASAETVMVSAQAGPVATSAVAIETGGLRNAAAPKTKKAPAPALQYQLLRRMPGGNLEEVAADGTVPAGATMILRITPSADGDLRIVEGTRTIASHAVRRGKVLDTTLPKFKRPGRVELQVYFPSDPQTPVAIAFNIQ